MKKFLALLLAAMMLLCSVSAMAEVKIGQVQYAAHGTKCFAVLTVVMDGDLIVDAKIDEFQMMAADSATAVPNSEVMFADQFAAGQVLASKRVNNELYSSNMASHAGATQQLVAGYTAIENFVIGKTIAEVEAAIADQEKEAVVAMVDAVSSCTLVDTKGYIEGLLAAAKSTLQTGYYTLYNMTGETVTEVTLTINETGATTVVATDMAAEASVDVVFSMDAELNGHGALTLAYTTESGRSEAFVKLSIETAPIQLLSQEGIDAMSNATVIKFAKPE